MKPTIGLGVSERVFKENFKRRVTEDIPVNQYHQGEIRGRLKKKNKLYMYISGDTVKMATTVLKGKFDDREVKYSYTKLTPVIIIMTLAVILWLVFSVVMFLRYGPIGFLGLLGIVIIMIPMMRNSSGEKELLEKELRKMCINIGDRK